jgi:hypothetical protein
MTKFFQPSEIVQAELKKTLNRRYPDAKSPSISYDNKSSKITATVTYYDPIGSSIALFEYCEHRSPTNTTYSWYCSNDWND